MSYQKITDLFIATSADYSSKSEKNYICISDIAKVKTSNSRAADVIRNWLRNRSTLDFLTTWEQIYNPNFKVFE